MTTHPDILMTIARLQREERQDTAQRRRDGRATPSAAAWLGSRFARAALTWRLGTRPVRQVGEAA